MFTNSLEERSQVLELKREHNRYSDHFALLDLYEKWKQIYDARESDELFCIRNMLRGNTLRLISRKFFTIIKFVLMFLLRNS